MDGGLGPEAEIGIPHRKPAPLAQATESEQSFPEFVGRFVGRDIGRLNELRIVNTTCKETVGVTASASTPDESIDEVVARLEKLAKMLHAKEQRAQRLPLSNLMDA